MQLILQQAAEDGRGKILFGDSLGRVEKVLPPFLSGDELPAHAGKEKTVIILCCGLLRAGLSDIMGKNPLYKSLP